MLPPATHAYSHIVVTVTNTQQILDDHLRLLSSSQLRPLRPSLRKLWLGLRELPGASSLEVEQEFSLREVDLEMELYLSRAGLLMRFSYFLRTLAPLSSPGRAWLLLISLSGDSCELMAMISSSVRPESCSRCLFQLRRLYLCLTSLTIPSASSSGSYFVKVPLRRKSLALAAMSSSKNSTKVLLSPSSLKSTPQVRQKSRKVTKVACWTSQLSASKMVRSACSQSCCEYPLSAQRWQRLRQGTFLSSSPAFAATMSAAEAQNFSQGCNRCSIWKRQSASARVSCVKRNLSAMAVSSWQVSSLIQRGQSTLEADLRRLRRQ